MHDRGPDHLQPKPASAPTTQTAAPEAQTSFAPSAAGLLGLQRSAGNAAVQRQVAALRHGPGLLSSPGIAGAALQRTSLTWRSPDDSFVLEVDGQQHMLSREQADAYVRRVLNALGQRLMDAYSTMSDHNRYARMGHDMATQTRGMHGTVRQAPRPSAVREFFSMLVAVVSEAAGGVEMPGPEIYAGAQDAFDRMFRAIRSGDLVAAFDEGQAFERPFNEGAAAWRRYIDGAISGAESSAGTLETVRDVSFAVVAAYATGGLATGLTGASVGGVVLTEGAATVIAATTTGAGTALATAGTRELGEFIATGDTAVDWARGAEEILAGAAAGAFTGAVGNWVKGAVVSRLYTQQWFRAAVLRYALATGPASATRQAVERYLIREGPAIAAATATTIFTAAADAARELRNQPNLTLEAYLSAVWGKLRNGGYAETVWRVIAGRYGVNP